MRNSLYIIICFFLFLSCSTKMEKDLSVPVISIEEGVANFVIEPLSKHASNLSYVRLETKDECLVTQGIKQIYLEDNKIFVYDNDPYLKVFDVNTGKYLYNIGKRGQGPGELSSLMSVDFCPIEKTVILNAGAFNYQYDFKGNYIGRIERPSLGMDTIEIISSNVIMIDENIFAAGAKNYMEHQLNALIVFDRNQKILFQLESYDDITRHPDIMTWHFTEQEGVFYKSNNKVFFFRVISDTIYVHNKNNNNFEPYLCFDWGKHKTANHAYWKEENKNVIKINSIEENERYLFMDFYTANSSPEPFDDEVWRSTGRINFVSHDIFGIYDKKEKKMYCLLQPIRGIRGLKNDIDNGLPFWPRYVSSQNKLVDYIHPYKLLDFSADSKNLKGVLKDLILSINEDDNPIVVIAE